LEARELEGIMKNKEMEYYKAGFERAYKLYKEDPEELEKEYRFRQCSGVNSRLTARQIDIGLNEIKDNMFETVLTMAIGVLHAEFGFGKKRLTQFKDTFMDATIDLAGGIMTWMDICQNIKRETGIEMDLVKNLSEHTGLLIDE
jgi:hypothetical protein